MSSGSKLIGVDKVLANLNKEVRKIEGATSIGIRAAGELIKGRAIPLTPIKTSNLRGSYNVTVVKTLKGIVGIISNSAAYAIFVHERMELKHSIGQSKFLETAIKNSRNEILRLIAKFARVK